MSAFDGLTVNLVDSVDEAGRFLSWLSERRPALAVDTETTGVGWTDTVRMVQFGDGKTSWSIPTRDWRGVARAGLEAVQAEKIVLHNANFDRRMIENDGLPALQDDQVHDTLVMARLLEPARAAGLKPLCSRLFGREAVAGQALLSDQMRKNKWTWATVPDDLPAYWAYAGLDTSLTALAFEKMAPLVDPVVYEREMAVLSIMYGAEKRGMRIDPDYTQNLLSEWRSEAAGLRTSLQAAGIENPSSNAHVTAALKMAGWEPEEFTDTGLPKLDKVVLASLADRYGDMAEPLLRYRRLVKWCSTYLERFLRDRDSEDRVHPSINTLGARTGRMSITNPPLQTLPSREASIRGCIRASDGGVLYAIDYRQMEPRIVSILCGDPAFTALILSGKSLYETVAAEVYGRPDPTDDQIKLSKVTLLSRMYGAGPEGIAASAFAEVDTVRRFLAGFDDKYPGVARLIERVEDTAKQRVAEEGEPYIISLGGRRVPGDADKLYAMTNYLMQSSATDLFKKAIVALDCAGLGKYIVCPIHDELLFDFPEAEAADLALYAQEIMEDHTTYAVPMLCSVTGPLRNWGEAYE